MKLLRTYTFVHCTASNTRQKGQENFKPPSVDELKAFLSLYIAENDFLLSFHLI